MLRTISFLVIKLLTIQADTEHKYYKVSMVASVKDPSHPVVLEHGESPVWDNEEQCLLFVDVYKQDVHRLDYKTGEITTKHIDYGQVNVVSAVRGSKRYLVAVRSSLYLLDFDMPNDTAIRLLTTVDLGQPDNVINEGKSDIDGRYWMGTKGPQNGDKVVPGRATFYSFSQTELANPRIQLKPVTISNGLTWALNNSVLYYIDSTTQKVEAYDYDAGSGTLSNGRTIIDVTMYGYESAIPDGMTIDTNGNLWVAIMRGGTVLHVDPNKQHVIFEYQLPVSRVTSLAWGGPALDELFVTTSRRDADTKAEPLSGAIFTLRDTGASGLPDHRFLFNHADEY